MAKNKNKTRTPSPRRNLKAQRIKMLHFQLREVASNPAKLNTLGTASCVLAASAQVSRTEAEARVAPGGTQCWQPEETPRLWAKMTRFSVVPQAPTLQPQACGKHNLEFHLLAAALTATLGRPQQRRAPQVRKGTWGTGRTL